MKYIIATLGCKVNQYESEAMEQLLRARGHERGEKGEAELVIVNSCAVTAEGERKARQTLRRLAKENPGALLAVCGCWSQVAPEAAAELGASVIYGTGDHLGFLEAIEGEAERRSIPDTKRPRPFEELPAGAYAGHARASLKIEDGCDNFCSYCIIPHARGRVCSLGVEKCAQAAAELEARGYREAVITGIEIASYGKDLPGRPDLVDACEAMCAAAPSLRLHLGSLEPRCLTEEAVERLRKLNICPHFHLSLQSGCDATLKRMNRKYDTALFYAVVERLRRAFPGCAITTDLICGFPGETEEEFEATLAFIRRCDFAAMHIFPYSVRPGTPAAKMEQLTQKVKTERAARAIAAAEEMEKRYLQAQLGRTLTVIFETERDGVSRGHSENYVEVAVEEQGLRGLVKNVKITGLDGKILVGSVL